MKTSGDIWTTFLHGLLALQLLGSAQPASTDDASCHLLNSRDSYTTPKLLYNKQIFFWRVGLANCTAIVCEDIADFSDAVLAERSLRELSSPGQKMGIFFQRCNLDVLPANFLASLEVSFLQFLECNMSDIPYDLINSLRDTLSVFWIVNSPVLSRTISAGRFQYNPYMTEVSFGGLGIESVEEDAFDRFPNLTSLSMSSNKIRSLDKGVFKCMINLKQLYIRNNEIGSLDEHLFVDLINLYKLDINGNRLTTLTDGIFDPLEKLENLDAAGNKLHCNCDLQWLQDWINDLKLKDPNFIGSVTCRTPKAGDIREFNICNSSRTAKETKKKTSPRDCSINESWEDQTWFKHVASFLFSFFAL